MMIDEASKITSKWKQSCDFKLILAKLNIFNC